MTLKRQYTLPNCNLILEGLVTGDESDPNAPLTVLLNTEFVFPGLGETLSGGREFLETMMMVVSDYAQGVLSGVPRPETLGTATVQLTPGAGHLHQLRATVTDAEGNTQVKNLTLSSVQLFDLVEAIDQVFADTLTLPDLTLKLTPLDRRHARPLEPISKKAAPIATGLSALAAAAAMLFMVPVPQVEAPRRSPDEQATLGTEQPPSVSDTETPSSTVPPSTTGVDGDSTDSPENAGGESAPADTSDQAVGPVDAATALSRLSIAPEITDADTLRELETSLEKTLEEALVDPIPFEESLTYRVAVSGTGDLLGYKYESDAALLNVALTPLPELTFVPLTTATEATEPVAQFRVTFNPDGSVQAEPLSSVKPE